MYLTTPLLTPTNARRICWYRIGSLLRSKDLAIGIPEAESCSRSTKFGFDTGSVVLLRYELFDHLVGTHQQ